jgi:hypothetical protein
VSTTPKRYQLMPFDRTTFLPKSHTGTATAGSAVGTLGGSGYKVRRAKTADDARRIGDRNQLGQPTGYRVPGAKPTGTLGVGLGAGVGASPKRIVPPVAKPAARTSTAAPAPNPFAPQTDAQLQTQASSQVNAQFAPILKQIADSINARAQAGADSIAGLTKFFGPQLATLQGINTAGLQTGIQGQAAIDNALYQSLAGGGNQLASELGGQLAQINAPAAASQTGAQQQIGQGAANASLATGSAALSALNSRLATAKDIAAKVPGLAPLFGLQATRDLQAQSQQNLADQTGQVTSQAPGLIQNVLAGLRSNELSKAQEAERIREFGVGQANAKANARSSANARIAAAEIAAGSRGAAKPFTLGPGQEKYVPNGKGGYTVISGPSKAAAASRPFTIRPGDTVEVPDGKGGYKGYTAPAAPKDPKAPVTKNTPQGTIQWDPKTRTWSKIPDTGPAAKPTTIAEWKTKIALTATTGAYDPKTGSITPELRQQIIDATGHDPGLTVSKQDAIAAGWTKAPKAPKAPPTPRAPKITGTSPTSKFVVTYNPDGSVKSKEPNPNYVPPRTPAGADPAKAKASALKTANQTALRITQADAKKTPVYKVQQVIDPNSFTQQKVTKRVPTGKERYSKSYYKTIHEIEAATEDLLSPHMTRSERIRFAQRYANAAYDAGTGGRPRTAAQAEKNAPTPPTFPRPKGPSKPHKPKVTRPRAQFDAQFPLGGL